MGGHGEEGLRCPSKFVPKKRKKAQNGQETSEAEAGRGGEARQRREEEVVGSF